MISSINADLRMSRKARVLLLFFLYCFAFQPPIVDKFVFLVVWLILFSFLFVFRFKYFLRYLKIFWVEVSFGLLMLFWAMSRDLASGEIVYSDRFFVWLFSCFIFPACIIYFIENRSNIDSWMSLQFLNFVYCVCIFAGILTLLLIMFPAFDTFYESVQVAEYYDIYENFEFRYRAYGIAENLSFTYGYVLGIFAGYSLLKAKGNLLHIFFFPILLVGVAFNARIGFLPVILSLIFLLFSLVGSLYPRLNIRLLVSFILLVSVFIVLFHIYESYFYFIRSYFSWALSFFDEIFKFLGGDRNNTLGLMFGDFIVIPTSLKEIIFGSGVSIYGAAKESSDIGYIIQLNYAGIFFVFLLVCFLLWCSLRLALTVGYKSWFLYIFVFSVFFLNLKGFLFAGTPGARLIFLLYIYFIIRKKKLSLVGDGVTGRHSIARRYPVEKNSISMKGS